MNQLLAPGVVLTEVLCASYVLLLHQPQRDYFPLRFLCSITVCYLSLILWLIPGNEFSNMMKYITIYLLVFLSILACMKFTATDALYWWLAGMIMQHATYSITFLCSRLISSLFFSLPFLILLNIIVWLFEYFFIERKLRGNYNFKKDYRQTLLVTIAILGTTVVLNSSKNIFSNRNDPALTIITSIYSLICCVFAMMTLMGNFQKNRLENELVIVEQLWHNEQKQFEASKQNVEMLNMYCHDLKHLLTKFNG